MGYFLVQSMTVKSTRMEKITIKEYNNDLEIKDSISKIKAVDAACNDILVSPGIVAQSGGCGTFRLKDAMKGKWYRVALSGLCYTTSSVLLNVGSRYKNNSPCAQLFYIASDGYSGAQNVVQLGVANKCISKVRLLFINSTTQGGMLDIYISSNGSNDIDFAYSNNIGFTFQTPVEVSEEPDTGYKVKEFAF